MRAFLLLAVLLLGLCSGSRAQNTTAINVKSFPDAALVLTTGAMLTGPLQLYPEDERVAITCANDSTYTLPAQLIQGFAVTDPLLDLRPTRDTHLRDTYLSTKRVFRAFPLATRDKAGLSGWGFYEQLSHGPGPVLLLRREQTLLCALVTTTSSSFSPTSPAFTTVASQRMVYNTMLYLRTDTGAMVELKKPQELLKYFPEQKSLLRAYVRENNLHYANLRDLSFIVNYANTLLKPTP